MGSRRKWRLRCPWYGRNYCWPILCADLLADTEGKDTPVDPLAALEKSTEAQNHLNNVQVPRLEAIQSLADHYGSDPYSLSRKVRKRFREDKKVEKAKQAADDELKGRYGLPAELLLTRDDEATREKDKEEWMKAQSALALRDSAKRRKLEVAGVIPRPRISSGSASSSRSSAADLLKARVLANSARRPPDVSGSSGLSRKR